MLSYLRERVGQKVSAFAGQPPVRGLLTLPALYGPAVERLLREAGQAAGFAEVELVPEPVAAAQAWLANSFGSSRIKFDASDVPKVTVNLCSYCGGSHESD